MAGGLTLLLGLLVLLGWELSWPVLMRGWPDWPATKRLTALLLLVMGLILLTLPPGGAPAVGRRRWHLALAAGLFLGTLYAFLDIYWHHDEKLHGWWLFREAELDAQHTRHPGQLALPTALAMAAFALAAGCRQARGALLRQAFLPLILLGLVLSLFGGLALLYGSPELSIAGGHNAMAMPTVIGLALAFSGLAAASPASWGLPVLQHEGQAGRMTRRLLPLSLILPLALGWLAQHLAQGQRDVSTWLALVTLFISLALALATLWQGQRLRAAEVADQAATAEIRRLNTELEARVASRTAELELANAQLQRQQAQAVLDNQELAHLAADLRRSNEDLQQFAHAISHDLQEPVRGIIGCLQLLTASLRGQLAVDDRELLDHAVQGGQRLRAMITGLLAYSRVGTGGLRHGHHELTILMAAVQANLAQVLVERQAVIQVTQSVLVPGDGDLLIQVLQNLVSNGIKFNRASPPRISISGHEQPGGVELRITDNGIGIEANYHERIFLLHQRLHSAKDYPGTGAGLALCRRIVERHGGRLWVVSSPGQGSTFHLLLKEPAGHVTSTS